MSVEDRLLRLQRCVRALAEFHENGPGAMVNVSAGRETGTIAKMSTVAEIEQAITRLTPDELRALRAWFAEHDAKAWDQQFEDDVAAGRLEALGEEALRDMREGRGSEL